MPVKKEICRNFARGSCQFGQRCRYLHVNPQSQQQQQSRPTFNNNNNQNSNIFSKQNFNNHNNNNPYGFGVQNNSQPKGFAQNQPKAFDNTWNRFSANTASSASAAPTSSRQSENHKCTDAETCRRMMVDDFQNERPLWKLTCYGHWRGAPCDVVGDISYEELRAAAYDDAKRGLNLQSIVERERGLLNSKLAEFNNLCKPRAALPSSNLHAQNPFPQTPAAPMAVSSFSQLATSQNTGFGPTSPAPLSNTFGPPNPFQGFSQTKFPTSESQVANPFGPTRAPTNPFSTPVRAFDMFNSNPPNQQSTREVVAQPRVEDLVGVDAVWLKDKWNPGEIPEEAPPDAACT